MVIFSSKDFYISKFLKASFVQVECIRSINKGKGDNNYSRDQNKEENKGRRKRGDFGPS